MRTSITLLALIGVAVALRRLVFLLAPPADPAGLDVAFAQHRLLTAAHVLPGLLFMLLAPLQLLSSLRARRPGIHRWLGRVAVVDGLVIGITGLVMTPRMSIGGAIETVAIVLFGSFFVFALARGYTAIRRGRIAEHREWMVRASAVGLAVATIRPIVGLFFATSRVTHLAPHDFFGIAFWVGFTANSLAAEFWIRTHRPAPMVAAT